MPVNAGRSLLVAGGMLLAAVSLGACEYEDAEPQPGGSTAALPSAPADSTMDAGEAARQAELMAEVESLMGEPEGVVSLGAMGGLRDGRGITTGGLLRDTGTYTVRALCTTGPGATVTVRQHGELLLSQRIECGAPHDTVLDLTAGEVSAALDPIGDAGPAGGAVRFAGPA